MNIPYYARLRLYFNLIGDMEITNDLTSDHQPTYGNAAFNPSPRGHHQITGPRRLGADIPPDRAVDPQTTAKPDSALYPARLTNDAVDAELQFVANHECPSKMEDAGQPQIHCSPDEAVNFARIEQESAPSLGLACVAASTIDNGRRGRLSSG